MSSEIRKVGDRYTVDVGFNVIDFENYRSVNVIILPEVREWFIDHIKHHYYLTMRRDAEAQWTERHVIIFEDYMDALVFHMKWNNTGELY